MLAPWPPPPLRELPAGTVLYAGAGTTTIIPDLDFESYSEAGFVWNEADGKWDGPPNAPQNKRGLKVVGAAVYALHPSTEVISLAYDLKDGRGRRRWRPGMPAPQDLFDYMATGGLLEAFNCGFEHWMWNYVCVPKYGFPPLPQRQLRCAMAKARAFGLPGKLENVGEVLKLSVRKDAEGKRLIDKFCIPRKPTKHDPRRRIRPEDDPADAERLYSYNETDIVTEAEASSRVPDLTPDELEFWLEDQAINHRGVAVDAEAVANCISIIQQAFAKYTPEIKVLTGGAVESASQLERLKGWLGGRGIPAQVLDEDAIDELLKLPSVQGDTIARRVLELRQLTGSASIKKLFAIRNQMTPAGRLHDLFAFHAARTGRATGNGPQPHNLPKAGPAIFGPSKKGFNCCGRFFGAHTHVCPWCGVAWPDNAEHLEWNAKAAEDALAVIATGSLECVELFFGDACQTVVGCLRGLFVAGPDRDLIASDYSAIEAVVLAVIAGEDWRIQVFKTHGKIYEVSASKVTGISLEDFLKYKAETDQHRPERQKVGKCLELACGYGGWIGATKADNIAMDRYFNDEQIKGHILNWRRESPWVVELWGGQHRGLPWDHNRRAELFGLEGAAIAAVLNPGTEQTYKAPHPLSPPITYFVRGDVLYCRLPSGRLITYHEPRLRQSDRCADEYALSYMGWNTNPKQGAMGWVRMDVYGGKLVENVVQAVARDILRDAILRLARATYGVVLHVHDEIVAEVARLFGSIEEFEAIMNAHAPWAFGWPIFARGGWRGRRFRKD